MPVFPAVGELMTTVQEPVPPAVVHLDGPTHVAVAPPEFVKVKLITVPSGASWKPEPVGETFTWPVSVWFVPMMFVACNGLIWIFASGAIQTLFASALS